MKPPANTNERPIVQLRSLGDGHSLARVLARVLVRRELMFATAIPEPTDCDHLRAAG